MLTPTEILEKEPEVKKHFTVQQIGYLKFVGLARGRSYHGKQQNLVCLEDVLKVVEFKKAKK